MGFLWNFNLANELIGSAIRTGVRFRRSIFSFVSIFTEERFEKFFINIYIVTIFIGECVIVRRSCVFVFGWTAIQFPS